jgi:O-antigen/teichoic acid export membrane protein
VTAESNYKKTLNEIRRLALPTSVFAISLVVSFVTQAALGQMLGVKDFGAFSAYYAQIAIVASILTAGFDVSALKIASLYISKSEADAFRKFLNFGCMVIIGAGGAFSIAAFLFNSLLSSSLINALTISLVTSVVWALGRFFASLLRALNYNSTSLFVDRIVRDATLGFFACYWFVLDDKQFLQDKLRYALLIGVAIGAIISVYIVAFNAPKASGKPFGSSISKSSWVETSVVIWLINVIEMIFSRSEVIALSLFNSMSTAGLFSIILTISMFVTIPSLALNVVYQPRLASIDSVTRVGELKQVVSNFSWFSFPLAMLISLPILFFPEKILGLYGLHDVSAEVIYCLKLLVFTRLALALLAPSSSVLLMNGGHKQFLVLFALVFIVKLFALKIFVATASLTQFSIISTLSLVAFQVLSTALVWQKFGFYVGDPSWLWRKFL